ncbi:MAG: hypothetical protein ISN29_05065 [Gammaproteobacteria bacterium AqS3]|nr:hypothetical protein [Gammaproteobacteria bacterium AqS3]
MAKDITIKDELKRLVALRYDETSPMVKWMRLGFVRYEIVQSIDAVVEEIARDVNPPKDGGEGAKGSIPTLPPIPRVIDPGEARGGDEAGGERKRYETLRRTGSFEGTWPEMWQMLGEIAMFGSLCKLFKKYADAGNSAALRSFYALTVVPENMHYHIGVYVDWNNSDSLRRYATVLKVYQRKYGIEDWVIEVFEKRSHFVQGLENDRDEAFISHVPDLVLPVLNHFGQTESKS